MVKHINSNNQGNYAIVGIDLVGALLASRIAFALQKPLSYVVPTRDKQNNANHDIEVNIESFDRIVLITDAIVTYETVERVIAEYGLEKRLISIYCIFYRSHEYIEDMESKYISKTYSINNSLNIELYEKEKCIYKDIECKAENRKLN